MLGSLPRAGGGWSQTPGTLRWKRVEFHVKPAVGSSGVPEFHVKPTSWRATCLVSRETRWLGATLAVRPDQHSCP